jgi:hypothetical protein
LNTQLFLFFRTILFSNLSELKESEEKPSKEIMNQERSNKTSTDSSCSSSRSSSYCNLNTVSAPDGGWGWMVVFASFMIHLIADGVTYTFGIFYFELLKHFASGKGLTAWIPSIMTGMTFAIGQ